MSGLSVNRTMIDRTLATAIEFDQITINVHERHEMECRVIFESRCLRGQKWSILAMEPDRETLGLVPYSSLPSMSGLVVDAS